jgi:hypothetical protein
VSLFPLIVDRIVRTLYILPPLQTSTPEVKIGPKPEKFRRNHFIRPSRVSSSGQSLPPFLTIFYMFRTSLTATEARIGLRVKATVNESAPRSERRKRSNTMPSETPLLPSRRKRRSLPLNFVKQRRSEWHEERGERKYSLMKSYKFLSDMTSTLFFSLFLLLYVI